jgi:tight adherence protein B
MNPLLVMLLTFLGVALAVVGVYSVLSDLFLRDRSSFSRRVDEEFRKRLRDQARKSSLFKNLEAVAAEAGEGVEADRPGLRRRFEAMVEQSGLGLTPGRVLGFMVGAGCAGAALAFLLRGLPGALAGGAAAASLPWLYVYLKRKWRLDKLLSQLPDTFDLMARVIRAGQTVPQAMQAVADEFDAPVSAEFSFCYEQQNLGLPPDVALRDLSRRTGLLEIKIFVLAMLVQQQSGGNLAELLENLATVVRERFRVRGKIKTLTAEGRFQAAILLALPPLLLLAILFLNPRYGQVLLDHPNLVVGMFVSEGLGALIIRKIINFDF